MARDIELFAALTTRTDRWQTTSAFYRVKVSKSMTSLLLALVDIDQTSGAVLWPQAKRAQLKCYVRIIT